jgi:hypothetical protein
MSFLSKTAVLLFPLALVLAGCVEEDAITITADGAVTFKSIVTVSDHQKKISFKDVDKGVSDLMAELQQAKWTVERKWLSEARPYAFEITGSGNLRDVAHLTKFYALTPVVSGFYRLIFVTPQGEDDKPTRRRVIFTESVGEPAASIHDAEGRVVTHLEDVSGGGPYGIRMPPRPQGGGATPSS